MRRIIILLAIVGVLLMGRMIATRLGFGMGYAGVPTPPPSAGEGYFAVTSVPDGGWTELQDPKQYHYNGYTYVQWVEGGTGDLYVGAWNHATDTMETPVLISNPAGWGGSGPDLHDAGAMLVRESDKKLLIIYSGHSKGNIWQRISVNSLDTDPTLSGGLTAAQHLDSQLGGGRYTYPYLVQLRGVANDPIYLFYRDIANIVSNTGRIAFSTILDNGATTWAAQTLLFTASSNNVPYWRIGSDWDTRIDIITTDIEPDNSNGLWHFYIDGSAGTYHKTDGTAVGSLPLETADVSLVMDDTNGSMMGWGIAYDTGDPVTVVMQHPVGSSTDNAIRVVRSSSGTWAAPETVVSSVGGILGGNTYLSGAAIIDANTVVYSAEVGSHWEMHRGTYSGSWSTAAITEDSAVDHCEPAIVAFGVPEYVVGWLSGTYGPPADDATFDFGITASD